MSQHTVIRGISKVSEETYRLDVFKAQSDDSDVKWADLKFMFGWDQPLMSFYLQVHDAFVKDADANPVVWLGATADTKMYEVEDLVKAAKKHGLEIDRTMQMTLYGDKDDGR